MKSYNERHEMMRRKCWIECWAATASASNCDSKSVATGWADEALRQFDERFKQLEESEL